MCRASTFITNITTSMKIETAIVSINKTDSWEKAPLPQINRDASVQGDGKYKDTLKAEKSEVPAK